MSNLIKQKPLLFFHRTYYMERSRNYHDCTNEKAFYDILGAASVRTFSFLNFGFC